jgi:hypothetical protein
VKAAGSGAVYKTATTNSSYNEMMGLAGIVSASDPYTNITDGLQGKLVASNSYWKSGNITASSNRDLTEALMTEANNTSLKEGGDVSAIYCNYEIWSRFADLLTPDKRHVNTQALTSGWSNIEFQAGGKGIPVFPCKQAPPNKMFFVDERHLFFLHAGEIDWIDGTDGILHWDVGEDQFIGAMLWIANMATDHRGAHTLLANLNES